MQTTGLLLCTVVYGTVLYCTAALCCTAVLHCCTVMYCCTALLHCDVLALYCIVRSLSCRGVSSTADLASTPQLLLLCSRLLDSPPSFAGRYKPLLLRLMEPLQHNFNALSPEQMAQVGFPWVGGRVGGRAGGRARGRAGEGGGGGDQLVQRLG